MIQNFYHDTYHDILDKWQCVSRYVLWHFVYLCVRHHFFLLSICHIRPWKLKLIFEKKKKNPGTKEIICWNNIVNIVRSTQSYSVINIVRGTHCTVYRVVNKILQCIVIRYIVTLLIMTTSFIGCKWHEYLKKKHTFCYHWLTLLHKGFIT
jgi:membrane protein CcdC involved in cytochrome C biogenesis